MPKETFLNLPEEKRRLIENTAITEFAARGFDKASINVIVRECGIAKGSFYQYFSDKKDLFIYLLVTVAGGRKIEYMSPVLVNPESCDIFTLIKELFMSGLRFAAENPELEKLGMWLLNNTGHPVYQDLYGEAEIASAEIYINLLTQAQQRGEIRDDLDCRYISHVFQSLITATMDFCLKKAAPEQLSGVTELSADLMKTVDLMIDFMKNGTGTDAV